MILTSLQFPIRSILINDFGDSCQFLNQSTSINNDSNYSPAQPRGRYYAIGDQWAQWTLSPKARSDQGYSFEIAIGTLFELILRIPPSDDMAREPSRVIQIKNIEQARAFYKKYALRDNVIPCSEDGAVILHQIAKPAPKQEGFVDWTQIVRDFAGIEFALNMSLTNPFENDPEVNWMRGNPVSSGCVWDQGAIEKFVMVKGPRNDLRDWVDLLRKDQFEEDDCAFSLRDQLDAEGILEYFKEVREDDLVIGYRLKSKYASVHLLSRVKASSMSVGNLSNYIIQAKLNEKRSPELPGDLIKSILSNKIHIDPNFFRLIQLRGRDLSYFVTRDILDKYNTDEYFDYANESNMIVHFYPDYVDPSDLERLEKEVRGNVGFDSHPYLKEVKLWRSLLASSTKDPINQYWKTVREWAGQVY